MTGQLDLFTSPGPSPLAPVERVTPETAATGTADPAGGPAHVCTECGSTENVMFGYCRPCFDAWSLGGDAA